MEVSDKLPFPAVLCPWKELLLPIGLEAVDVRDTTEAGGIKKTRTAGTNRKPIPGSFIP
jgi:hypothetical protein